MEYFKSGLKSVLGGPAPGTQPTGAETVGFYFIFRSQQMFVYSL